MCAIKDVCYSAALYKRLTSQFACDNMIKKNILPEFNVQSIEPWHQFLAAGFDQAEASLIRQALDLALPVESIKHPMPRGIDAAVILKNLGVDVKTILAAVLADPRLIELSPVRTEEIFGEEIARLVENTNRLNRFNEYSRELLDIPEQAETLRRMLLAMVQDVRAVVIKLAYRIQRLRNIPSEDYAQRQYIARETQDIYAPLANRMGIAQLKWELEDLAFRYLQPQAYKKVANTLAENRVEREAYLEKFMQELRAALSRENISAEVSGRPKHIYSIWRKMEQKQLAFNELYDIRAVRIITDKIASCYEILGLVHGLWPYLPREFDDYIASPKGNGYQSLHTVVVGPAGAMVEIQIRTREMHQFAELGVAAHWRYKEGGKQDAAVEKSIASIRALLENKSDDEGLLADFQTELYADRIFVLTPKGQLKNLIKGSTPLDFAYAIHTEVGHRCRGAKVDGRIVPLTYQLKSGQRVEILTAKEGGPSRSWMDTNLGYLKSSHSINKVKTWFRQQHHEQHLHDGRLILEKERQRLGLEKLDLEKLSRHFHLNRQEDLLIKVGRGDISMAQLAGALEITPRKAALPIVRPRAASSSGQVSAGDSGIKVQGVGNILTHFARCCKPVPGDPIIGYITLGKGITIHRQECKNMLRLKTEHKGRLIDVSWGSDSIAFASRIRVEAFDRQGLLSDVTQILSHARANILDVNTHTDRKDLSVTMELTIEIRDTAHLAQILDKIADLRNILSVNRIG